MENILSLNEEIDTIMEKKLSVCDCNPCNCSEQKKNIYFHELEEILATFNNFLATFNKEYSGANLWRISRNSK